VIDVDDDRSRRVGLTESFEKVAYIHIVDVPAAQADYSSVSLGSDPGGGQRLGGLPECVPEPRVVGLEPDLRRCQSVNEPVMIVVGSVGFEPALDGGQEPHQLGSVFVALPRPFDGGGEFVQQSSQVVFHRGTVSLL
jgi:hypothetical protein